MKKTLLIGALCVTGCTTGPSESPSTPTARELGQFVLHVDPARGTASLEMLGASTSGVYGEVPFAADGNPLTNPPGTVQAVTTIALDENQSQGGLNCGVGENCFRVVATNFFAGTTLTGLYMSFDNLFPATNHNLLNGDPNPGLSYGGTYGGKSFGNVAPSGSAQVDLHFTAPSAQPYTVWGHFEADILPAGPCGGLLFDPGNGIQGCWYTSAAVGMTCTQVCSTHGGFDTAASQHSGNAVGFQFWPAKNNGGNWMSVECSSTDNNTNWGANGSPPDPNFSHGACFVNCACNN